MSSHQVALWLIVSIALAHALNVSDELESRIEYICKFESRIYAVTNQSVYAFGRQDVPSPLLAIGSSAETRAPIEIVEFHNETIVQLCSSHRHMLALSLSGNVWTWGWNALGSLHQQPVRLELSTEVSNIVCGPSSSFAITPEGEVYSWGANEFGQLGLAHYETCAEPMKIDHLSGVVRLSTNNHWMSVALTFSGRLLAWGSHMSSAPVVLESNPFAVRDIVLVYRTIIILSEDGQLYEKSTPKDHSKIFYGGSMRFKAISRGENGAQQFLLAETLEGGLLAWWDIRAGGNSFSAITLRELALSNNDYLLPIAFPKHFLKLFLSE